MYSCLSWPLDSNPAFSNNNSTILCVFYIRARAPLVTVKVKLPSTNSSLHEYSKVCEAGFDLSHGFQNEWKCMFHAHRAVNETYFSWLRENDNIVNAFNKETEFLVLFCHLSLIKFSIILMIAN